MQHQCLFGIMVYTLINNTQSNSFVFPHNSATDQALLETYVWPWAKLTALQHDSFTCQKYSKTHPWPTQRLQNKHRRHNNFGNDANDDDTYSSSSSDQTFVTNFVGARFAVSEKLKEDVMCPKRCRPSNHQEWIQC